MPKLSISTYIHFIPPAPVDESFPSQYKFTFLDTLEKVEAYCERDTKVISFDLETTGLNPTEDQIVGVALCDSVEEAVYIPIHHHNMGLGKKALDLIYAMLCKKEKVVVFNLRFDFRMMEWCGFKEYGYLDEQHSCTYGYDMSKIPYLDVAVPCFLADSNIGAPFGVNEIHFKEWYKESNKTLKIMSLKHYSLHFLGWKQSKYQEVVGSSESLYYLNAQDVVEYAATDALATYHLAIKTSQFMKESGFAAQLDNGILYPLMRCEQNTIKLDNKQLIKIKEEIVPTLNDIKKKLDLTIAKINPSLLVKTLDGNFQVQFNYNSSPQRRALFQYMGVDTGSYSQKTGDMRTGMHEMEVLLEKYPEDHMAYQFAKLFIDYQKLSKLESAYVEPFEREIALHGGRTRFGYRTSKVPTGRLAGGKESDKIKGTPFFSRMNIQSIAKPKTSIWYTRKIEDEPVSDIHFLGWEFQDYPFLPDRDQWTVEGMTPKLNLRNVLVADEDYTLVCIDFSGQETRVPANMADERVWIDAFLRGEDLHKVTAETIWGKENYTKDLRRRSKTATFGLLYGGNEYTMMRNLGITEEEAKIFVRQFKSALPRLFSLFDKVIEEGRSKGSVYTYFKRPRRVKYFFSTSDFRLKSFGDRTSVNSIIQGAGADILKIAFLRLWNELYNHNDWKKDCNFIETVHDEIASQVKNERLFDFAKKKMELMRLKVPGWVVPMDVEVSFGKRWGEIFAFEYKEDLDVFIPKFESEEPYNFGQEIEKQEVEIPIVDDEDEDFDKNILQYIL